MRALSGKAKKEKERAALYYCPCEAEGEYLKKTNRKLKKGIHSFMSSQGLFYSFPCKPN